MDDLVLVVAEKLSIVKYRSTDGTPYLPVSNTFQMTKCLEMVNRGMRLFSDAAPKEGWNWKRRLATVLFVPAGTGDDNIDSDPARYLLPLYFGGEALGKITYAAEQGQYSAIDWVPESVIRESRSGSISSGIPRRAAILPYSPTSPTAVSNRRWEIIFDPEPSSALTVTFPYLLNFDGVRLVGGVADSADATTAVDSNLSMYPDDYFIGWIAEVIDGTGRGSYASVTDFASATGTVTVADWLDLDGGAGGTDPEEDSEFVLKPCHPYYHPAGFSYDGAVEAACLAACELFCKDEMYDGHSVEFFYRQKLPEAYAANKRQVPRRRGRVTNGRIGPMERTWTQVTTDHDI